MRKFYKRIFMTLIGVAVLVTSGIFLASFGELPGAEVEVSAPEPPTPGTPSGAPVLPEASAAPATAPEPPIVTPEPVRMASEHFRMGEYACDCGGYCDGWPAEMDPELLARVEALRMACGRPVVITSGVRCGTRNEEVGGVSWSFHKRGLAADLYCPGMGVGNLAALAQETGLNVLPYYRSGYIHVECP